MWTPEWLDRFGVLPWQMSRFSANEIRAVIEYLNDQRREAELAQQEQVAVMR